MIEITAQRILELELPELISLLRKLQIEDLDAFKKVRELLEDL
jgi:hypothetical protein